MNGFIKWISSLSVIRIATVNCVCVRCACGKSGGEPIYAIGQRQMRQNEIWTRVGLARAAEQTANDWNENWYRNDLLRCRRCVKLVYEVLTGHWLNDREGDLRQLPQQQCPGTQNN